jgi:hypothetical protein
LSTGWQAEDTEEKKLNSAYEPLERLKHRWRRRSEMLKFIFGVVVGALVVVSIGFPFNALFCN